MVASTSIITITELFSAPFVKNQDQIMSSLDSLASLAVVEIDRSLALEAARIRRENHLKLGDALQLATALASGAEVFITNDKDLKKFKELPVLLISEL